jgi:hypothetical protein
MNIPLESGLVLLLVGVHDYVGISAIELTIQFFRNALDSEQGMTFIISSVLHSPYFKTRDLQVRANFNTEKAILVAL